MTNLQSSEVSLRVDVSEVSAEIHGLRDSLIGLQKEIKQVGTEITKTFESVTTVLTEALSATSNLISSIPQQSGGIDGLLSGYSDLVGVVDSFAKMDASNGKILNLFEEIATAPDISNLIKSMLPKSASLASTIGEWVSTSLVPVFLKVLGKMGVSVGTGATNMFAPITAAFQNIDQLVGGKITGIGNAIKGVFGGITKSMSSLSLGWGAVIAVVVAAIIALVVVIVQNWDVRTGDGSVCSSQDRGGGSVSLSVRTRDPTPVPWGSFFLFLGISNSSLSGCWLFSVGEHLVCSRR